MHILLLTHYYPPEVNAPASRCSENARAWVAAGHRVTVVTCTPNHPAGRLFPGYANRLFQRETIDGVEVIRVWTWLAANEGFLPRIAGYVSYLVSVVLQRFRIPWADVVVSTSPQFFAGLAGWAFKSRRRPWVLEIRDLWPESIIAVGAMRRGFAIRVLERIEAAAYRAADRVVVVTDSFVDHVRARRPAGPIDVIKNGVDLTHFRPATGDAVAAFRAAHGLTGKFVASYVGTHGMAHGLDTILDAAEVLRDRADIAFLLVGAGAEKARLEAERDRRGLTNVVMLGQQPKAAMPTVWSATDAALVVLRDFDTFRSVIPSKMFEAMALAKPIVLGVAGEAAALLAAGDAGIAIPPEDSAALADAVRTLSDDAALAARLGSSGSTHVGAEFDRSVLAARYLALLEAAVAAKA
ncbi:glycosyltransferase family 4 protein [Sphingomonas donggukensis]|uniref:Glycosyltransferase family 4 protein n=1 Tax=Sphingomonas donggukensis TaxID=2949093 RepID=A0ABY4TPY9_9SPHN|nr:glycosyltransferase family 4 protein [Sphingomonas donggukensis]URW74453.1 glycosyltransferase family 4 protein [Sphingomonas donggukensis]